MAGLMENETDVNNAFIEVSFVRYPGYIHYRNKNGYTRRGKTFSDDIKVRRLSRERLNLRIDVEWRFKRLGFI